MRKMKKINGFLIVRFNDRERRNYPELGAFGVIDAEQYTGDLDIDRGAMEYDDADTIEVAVEQARGLDAEEDFPDEPTTYTLVAEDEGDTTETEVNPQLLIKGWETQLETQIKSPHYKDVDPRTAAHELLGYKAALYDLGVIDQETRAVNPDHFAPGMMEQPLPRNSEELVAHICDQICKHPDQAESQRKLDAKCAECVVGRLVDEAHGRVDRLATAAKARLDGLIRDIAETPFTAEVERLEHEAWAYLEALSTTKALTKREVVGYEAAISEASKARGASKPPCAHQDDDGHHVDVLLPTSEGLALMSPHDYEEGEIFTGCTVQALKCRRCGHESFAWSQGGSADQTDGRDPDVAARVKERLDGFIHGLAETPLETQAKRFECEARAYLEALTTSRTLTIREGAIYDAAITQAVLGRPEPPARETFENLPPEIKNSHIMKKVYALGLALSEDCPDNDCRVYLNIFNAAQELDAALDELGNVPAPALALRRSLMERVQELQEMYGDNYAIQQFKGGLQK